MPDITLANLRSRILERVNMENNDFISTAELNSIINVEGAELHDLLVSAFEDDYTISEEFTISSGNTFNLSSLASPFFKLRGIDRSEGGGDWQELRAYQFNERNRRAAVGYGPYDRTQRFRLIGSKLYITPDDAATGSYRIWYVPGYQDVTSDSATFSYIDNWYEYIVAGAAAILLSKEETDASFYLNQKAAMRERILRMAQNRDASGPITINRVVNRTFDDWDGR